jgi:hypothetical protein
MNTSRVEKVADAVLYEGYILYPYRASAVKNRQRFNFGVVSPKAYCEMQQGADSWIMQTECLVIGGARTRLEVKLRFLQLVARSVAMPSTPAAAKSADDLPEFDPVESLEVEGRTYWPWEEAVEREVVLADLSLAQINTEPVRKEFSFSSQRKLETLRDARGEVAGVIIRQQRHMNGEVQIAAGEERDGCFKVAIRLLNSTFGAGRQTREEALMHSMVSAHTILCVEGGEFVSLLDPPEPFKDIAAACRNVGTYPVLAGEEGEHNIMLSSPIILYDYPQVAPESAGEFFDGTEIDEMLALRVLTLTDDEKREMRDVDERARHILERTEALPPEHLMKLHGVLRGARPFAGPEE